MADDRRWGIWVATPEYEWWCGFMLNGVVIPHAWDRPYTEERYAAMDPAYRARVQAHVREVPKEHFYGIHAAELLKTGNIKTTLPAWSLP